MLARIVFLACLGLTAAFSPAAMPARAVAAVRPEAASIVMAPKGAKKAVKKAAPKKVVKKAAPKKAAAKKEGGGFYLTQFLMSGRDTGRGVELETLSGAGRTLDDNRVGILGFKDDRRPTKAVKVTSKSGTINPRDASTW